MEEKSLKIMYVASEASPFVQTGGLGDVMGALPTALAALRKDCNIGCILPLYKQVGDIYRDKMQKLLDISFNLSWRNTGAAVYSLDRCGVTYYFIENHYYFDRESLYGEYDDGERFVFFGRAVAEFLSYEEYTPDVLHANDWQASSAILFLNTDYKHLGVKTVFTIHNIEFQGKMNPYVLGDVFGLNESYLEVLSHRGDINLMKCGMILADKVTTVSPNYACELRHDYFSHGLGDIVNLIYDKLVGIINGIDYGYYSPELGGDIDYKYSKRTVRSGKAKNKESLLRELSLSTDEDIPLLIMVTRLTEQKGIDLLLGVADELLSLNLQLIILGTGERKYEERLVELEKKYPNFKAFLMFDRVLAKRLYASADILLMPSKAEPCGLSQMIATAYGTVPIVRSVGGLCDTIIPYNNEFCCGFRFDNYNAHELLYTVKLAADVFKNKEKWHGIRKRAINRDFSWNNSAKEYMLIYEEIIK